MLTLASIGGAVCILLVIAALVFDISLMLFKTGSMSPTIPAGSMAVVREIPATDVVVGDVVTVDRPGKLPVTHRVIGTEPVTDGRVQLILQGDANPAPDAEPYVVERVRIVWWSVPGVAPLFVVLGRPWVMLVLAVLVAGLVTWAFWPRGGTAGSETDRPDTDGPDTDGPDTDGPDTDGPDTDGPETDGPDTDGPDTDGPETDRARAKLDEADPDWANPDRAALNTGRLNDQVGPRP